MVFGKYRFLLDCDVLAEDEKDDFRKISADPENSAITLSLKKLSLYLSRYYGKSALVAEGIGEDRIRTYGFGFEGKKVLIG